MPRRKERLDDITGRIYSDIVNNFKNYKNFTYEQKLEFVENAFNNVNEYYGAFYRGYNPNDTKFGFFVVEENYKAFANKSYGCVAYSLSSALNSQSPREVYKTMFHEFRHIRQGDIPVLSKVCNIFRYYGGAINYQKDRHGNFIRDEKGNLVPTKNFEDKFLPRVIAKSPFLSKDIKDNANWALSVGEIGANMSAKNMLNRISKYGLLKGDFENAKQIKFKFLRDHFQSRFFPKQYEKFVLKNLNEKDRLNYEDNESKWSSLSKEEQDLLMQNKIGVMLKNAFESIPAFFSQKDLCKVLKDSPIRRDKKGIPIIKDKQNFVASLRNYMFQNDFRRYTKYNFFGKVEIKSHGLFGLFKHKERVFEDEEFARFDKFGNLKETEPLYKQGTQTQEMAKLLAEKMKDNLDKTKTSASKDNKQQEEAVINENTTKVDEQINAEKSQNSQNQKDNDNFSNTKEALLNNEKYTNDELKADDLNSKYDVANMSGDALRDLQAFEALERGSQNNGQEQKIVPEVEVSDLSANE